MSSGTSPLGSLMNNPALLQALYPGLNLTSFATLEQEEAASLEAPVQNLSNEASNLTKISQAWTGIQTQVNTLEQDAQTLSETSTWSSPTASVSPSGVLAATASSGASAGTYSVNVTQQGAYDQWLSQSESSSSSALGLQGSFSINGVSVSVSSTDSLSTIAQKINDAAAGATATVMTGTSGGTTSYYLSLDSTSFSALTISDPSSILYGTGTSGLGLTNKQAGQPWLYTVNGVSTSSTTGTDSATVPDLTLNLETSGTATVSVTTSTSAAQSALSQFASDYNALQSTIAKATGKGDILEGDPTAEGIMQQVNAILLSFNSSAPVGYQSASNAGLTLDLQSNKTTTLDFSQSAFTSAAQANPQALQEIFTGTSGIATQLQTALQNLGQASSGVIAGIQTDIQSQISDLTTEESQAQSLVTMQQNALQQQFNQEMQALIAVTSQKTQLSGLISSLLNNGQSSSGSSSSSGG